MAGATRSCGEASSEREYRASNGSVFRHESDEAVRVRIVIRTLGVNSMRALGIRSSYKGRTVDA